MTTTIEALVPALVAAERDGYLTTTWGSQVDYRLRMLWLVWVRSDHRPYVEISETKTGCSLGWNTDGLPAEMSRQIRTMTDELAARLPVTPTVIYTGGHLGRILPIPREEAQALAAQIMAIETSPAESQPSREEEIARCQS